ncbi:MAG: ribosome small subunit-dependent GTPase A [Bacillota bacterium]
MQERLEGRITRVHSAFCMVLSGQREYRCVFRGRIRKESSDVYPGDLAVIREQGGQFLVENILPRKNLLIRPPVANVDQMIVVTALTHPPIDRVGIDRLLVHAEAQGIAGALCINKCDIENMQEIRALKEIYEKAGYPVRVTSATERIGLESLAGIIEGTVAVVAGPSGVGKSCLLSGLLGVEIEAKELGRTMRGRHTTKGVTLFRIGRQGFLADTPGFSKLESVTCEPHEIAHYYPEMAAYAHLCHFPRCLHKTEDLCQVKDALAQGKIAPERYASYLVLLDECLEKVKRKYE